MKYGYSILLGETLAARDIDYGDCGRGQVICPECKDPVFKVVRTETDTHYLSHYQATGAVELACALRVDAMSEEEVRQKNEMTRSQTLSIYYAGLDEMMAPSLEKIGVSLAILKTVRRSKTAALLLEFIESEIRETDIDEEVDGAVRHSKSLHDDVESDDMEMEEDTVDMTPSHARICREVLGLLFSEKGAKGLRRVTSAAWAQCMVFDPEGDRSDEKTAQMLDRLASNREFLERITRSSRKSGDRILARIQNDPLLLDQLMHAAEAVKAFALAMITHLDYAGHLTRTLELSPSLAGAAENAKKKSREADRMMRSVRTYDPRGRARTGS